MYNKLFTRILDSSIWLESDQTRLVWITLIAAMDEDGYVAFASVDNLAARARISLGDCKKAVKVLECPDKFQPKQEYDGRRIERVDGGWMILNATKYREMVTRIVAREQTRNRVAAFRERKRGETACNGGVTVCNGLKQNVTPSEAVSEAVSENNPSGPKRPDGGVASQRMGSRHVSPPSRNGASRPNPKDGFFKQEDTIPPFIREACERLENFIRQKHRIDRRHNPKLWIKEMRLLLQELGGDEKRLTSVLDRFIRCKHEGRVPIIQSAESFRTKFINVEAWLKRQNGGDDYVVPCTRSRTVRVCKPIRTEADRAELRRRDLQLEIKEWKTGTQNKVTAERIRELEDQLARV